MISLCTVLSRKYILLLDHPQANYQLKITASYHMMDVKDDIVSNIPKFIEEIQEKELLTLYKLRPKQTCKQLVR